MNIAVLLYSVGALFGLVGLWYASDRVVSASLVVAKKFSLNTFIIGAIFMALATGLPELLLGIISVFNDAAQISVGDVMASNFIDTVVVVGFSSAVAGTMHIIKQQRDYLLAMFACVVVVMGMLFWINTITPVVGAILLGSYALLMAFLWRYRNVWHDVTEAMHVEKEMEQKHKRHIITYGLGHLVMLGCATQIALYSGKQLAVIFSLPLEVLGATVFALATSLPEFVISVHAARRKAYGILLGNAFGAALQQGLFTLGLVAMLANKPLVLAPVFSLVWFMGLGFAVLGISIFFRRLHRTTGVFLVLLGALFIVLQGMQVLS